MLVNVDSDPAQGPFKLDSASNNDHKCDTHDSTRHMSRFTRPYFNLRTAQMFRPASCEATCLVAYDIAKAQTALHLNGMLHDVLPRFAAAPITMISLVCVLRVV
jgi:hypothetical protein